MTFKTYDKIKRFDQSEGRELFNYFEDELFIFEKMDGANFRFTVINGKLIFGSRTQQLNTVTDDQDYAPQNFQNCLDYIRKQTADVDLEDYEGLIFYGEAMHKHTLSYDWNSIPVFLGFDILDKETEQWLPFPLVETLFEELNLQTVPLLNRIYTKDFKEPTDDDVPVTAYPPLTDANQKAEGIVVKNYEKGIFVKYVREAFKEDNRKIFGDSPKYTNSYADYLIAKYCTNARIEKGIFFFLDLGKDLHMSLIPMVSGKVYQDIWEEELKTIIKSMKVLDLKLFKSGVTDRCRSVIGQVIENNLIKEK